MTTMNVTEPTLVHPILTTEQALLIHQALIARNSDPEILSENELEEARLRRELGELTTFFYAMTEHPEQFRLRSRDDNMRIIRAAKPVRGPAQTPKRNKQSQGQQKRTRRQKREEAEAWNAAVAQMEADRKEAEEAYEAEKSRIVARFEELARKESVRAEELQEVLELFGSPEAAARARELRADYDPQRRLDRAAESARSADEQVHRA